MSDEKTRSRHLLKAPQGHDAWCALLEASQYWCDFKHVRACSWDEPRAQEGEVNRDE